MNPPYINRELSWLEFNARVLAEAEKEANLPLDRLRFLAITSSNLDEFFMVRAAYLKERSKNSRRPDDTGMPPQKQLHKVLDKTRLFVQRQARCLEQILATLSAEGISFATMRSLSEEQTHYVRELFEAEILPVVTPLAVDPSRPFPFLLNKSLNIGVRLRGSGGENIYAVVQVPSILPRFISLPESLEGKQTFLPLEELIAHFLPSICNLYDIEAYGFFRITRSADFDADEDTDNLLEEMKRTLKKRKRGKAIRLEVGQGFDRELYEFLTKMLHIGERYIFEISGLMDLSALSKVASLSGFEHLRPEPVVPVSAADFVCHGTEDIFALIRERDRMVHHPYESFDHVVDFLHAAAADPDVLAIKQTLYRVSGKSQVLAALEQAAELGKQVTVLVELKARFDEENNILWANRLERAGCHVIYGLTGLKTHCKLTLVVRREASGIRRYVHMSSGNYNDVTARLYTDIGMFTCRPAFGADASALFNHLTGYSRPPEYHKLVVAPENLKGFILEQINLEIQNARKALPCGISIKVNSLLDGEVVRKLYEASQAGVPVRLLIRGICSLLPGVPGYSENIQVRSIIGYLLEHSRIYRFENGGESRFFLGSADLMPRNLEHRVELLFPVEEPLLRQRLEESLELMWSDNTNAWDFSSDGVYYPVKNTGACLNSQRELSQHAIAALRKARAEPPAPIKEKR